MKVQGWHGLTSTLNYTWSHSIDTASDGLDFVPNAAMPDNSFNPRGERANSTRRAPARAVVLDLQSSQFQQAKWIANGWALDGMFNFATGQPYTVSYLFEGDYNGSGEYFGRRTLLVIHTPAPAAPTC